MSQTKIRGISEIFLREITEETLQKKTDGWTTE
jgi:hypothetical protein